MPINKNMEKYMAEESCSGVLYSTEKGADN